MRDSSFAVAIDGPGGSGKSTVAKLVAIRMQMVYIDTGAMYRAVGLYNMRKGNDVKNMEVVRHSLSQIDMQIIPHIPEKSLAAKPVTANQMDGQRLLLNGEDVTEALRAQSVAESASVVAEYAPVREYLLSVQQKLAAKARVVMDGRDIGSHVLPWAQVKIYLDADLDVRVKRRMNELKIKGEDCDTNTIKEEIIKRDKRDMTREIAPLIRANDAVYIDTGNLTVEQVADKIIELIKSKI